ncbi:MAG: hypothetical protein NC218_10020 [Acetobacter sp.]|nr:hypothetical protein [Acetobacter sp.]
MTTDELFRVLDALNPSVEQMEAYLDRLCGNTPLELVYFKDNQFTRSNSYRTDDANYLLGILFPNSKKIVLLKTINSDYSKLLDLEYAHTPIDQIQQWVKKAYGFIKA